MGEQDREGQEATGAGASRSQHIVLQGSADARTIAAAVRPGAERSREASDRGAPACIVVAPTIEQAFQAARQARAILADNGLRVVPVSSVTRARRVVAAAPVAIVTGTANDLLALRKDSVLSFETLRAIVIVALDDILAAGGLETLQSLLADAPSDAMRIVTLETETAETTAFLEANLRRARRISQVPAPERPLAVVPHYAITSAAGKTDSLRALLDDLDPPSLVVIAQTDDGVRQASEALAEMGVVVDDAHVRVTREAPGSHVNLVVFWEAPHTLEAFEQALASRPVETIALLAPEEVPAFRRLSGNVAEPFTAAARKENASQRINQLRTAIRSTLVNSAGATASELALLSPLLDTHDALEIAAASLRLYEGARRELAAFKARASSPPPGVAAVSSDAHAQHTTATGKQRLFLAVGKRDNVRPGDLVGAIANEAGISGDRIGAIELFESHALVELDAADATKAIDALRTVTVRGRKLNARIDDRGASTGARGASRGDRPAFRGGDRERGPRTFQRDGRGVRGAREGGERSERSPSGERGPRLHRDSERGDRGPRGGGGGAGRGAPRGGATEARRAFGDRPARERAESTREWSGRGEAMKHARRSPRPTRPDSSEE